jgi:hypothetical protein
MSRKLLALGAIFSIATFIAFNSSNSDAQQRTKNARKALERADAAFDEHKFQKAADDYLLAAKDLPKTEDRDRAIIRSLVSMSEGQLHQSVDRLHKDSDLVEFIENIAITDTRVDAFRMAGLYLAGRDHDYHYKGKNKARNYDLDVSKLEKVEARRWRYTDTTRADQKNALALLSKAHDNSRVALLKNGSKKNTERDIAISLEYCDLLEVVDRSIGKTRNSQHFFGANYESDYIEFPEPEEEGVRELDESENISMPGTHRPGDEQFTRRGYYVQPDYDSLSHINAVLDTATFRAEQLKDKALQASVLYRRAMLLINVGLYGNAELNVKLTDWQNPQIAEPDDALDPRPLLRRLLRDHNGSIWDDEAQFLLGYINYYLNDFEAARGEFKLLEAKYAKSRYIGEARRLIQVIEFPQLFTSFSDGRKDSSFVTPGQPLSISVYARNVESVNVSLKPIDLGKLLGNAANSDHLYTDLKTLEEMPEFESAIGLSIMDQSFKLNPKAKHFYNTRAGLPLYTQTTGVFLLEVKGGPVVERKLVQIADISVQRRRLAETEQFWVTTRNGAPIAGALLRGGYFENMHVEVPYRVEELISEKDPERGTHLVTRFREERRLVKHALEGESDSVGLFETALPPNNVNRFWATVDVEGTTYLVNDAVTPQRFTARPEWEPLPAPQRVKDLGAFVYTDRPVYRPGDTAFLRLITRLPMGEGTIEGEQVSVQIIAKGVEQLQQTCVLNEFGCATVRFDIPVGSPVGDYTVKVINPRIGGKTSFRLKVLEYFKKDIKLEVKAPSKTLVPGSDVEVPIQFSYLAGGNVQGGSIEYTVRAKSISGKSWTETSVSNELTNLDGRVTIAIDTESISEDAAGKAVTLTISASGTGPGGQTVHAGATIKISGSGVSVSSEWPKANWLTGKLNAKIRAMDSRGVRVKSSGSFIIWRITDRSSLRPNYWNNASERRVKTGGFNDNGYSDHASIALPHDSGRYRVELTGNAQGETYKLNYKFLYIGRGALENRSFEIVPEFNLYDLTKPTRVFISQPGSGSILLSKHANGVESDHAIVHGSGNAISTVALAESNAPEVHLAIRTVRNGNFMAASTRVKVEPASRRIRTIVRFDKKKYRPGDTATADIFTANHFGEGIQTEVALSVWDSALKEFATSVLEDTDLFTHFFSGRVSYTASDRDISKRTRIKPTRKSSASVKRWQTYKMPPGSFFSGTQCWTSSRRVSLLSMLEDPSESINELRIMEDAKNSLDADWSDSPPKAESPYYGLSGGIGGGGGRGGSGGFAHRRARGGGGMYGADVPDIPTRKNFKDSAFFDATIRTDENGGAIVQFTLPDNLTEWTFEATATDALAAVGQTSGTFTVSRDLNLRMVGPRGLVDGDEIELNALVQNLGNEAISGDFKVDLNVDDADATLTMLRAPETNFSLIKPGTARELRFLVKVNGTGEAKLKVSATTADDSDSLVWKYRVVPRGMPVVSVETFAFYEDEDTLEFFPDLPEGAVLDRSSLSIQFNGSIVGSVVDALPGLINYPYG